MSERRQPVLDNRDAEMAVLGSILTNPSVLSEVRQVLRNPSDFFQTHHQRIYQGICELADRGADPDILLLDTELKGQSYGGPAYLTELLNATPSSLHAQHYAKIVADLATRRRLVQAASDIAKLAYNQTMDITEVGQKSQMAVIDVASASVEGSPISSAEAVGVHTEWLNDVRAGNIVSVPTGLTDWDKILAGGLKQTTINFLGARTGMGKTAVACTVLMNTARAGRRPAFFSAEQPTSQILSRLMAKDVGVGVEAFDIKDGLSDAQMGTLTEVRNRLSQNVFFIDDTPSPGVLDVVNKCRILKRTQNIGLVIVDYLQLLQPPKAASLRYLELKYILEMLHKMARELHLPLLITAQLSRELDVRSDKRPILKDLRESGDIEQFAYTVTFLHREAFYDTLNINKLGAELIVAKHRQGPTGVAKAIFLGEFSRLENAANLNVVRVPAGSLKGTII